MAVCEEDFAEESRLRSRAMMYQRTVSILESITDELYAVDREWRFTYINERAMHRAREAQGEELTREDLLGKNMWELFPNAVGTTVYQELHRALRDQKTVEYVSYFTVTDRWIEVHAYPSEEGLSFYSRDITERKRAEEKLRFHASLLENIHDAIIATNERLAVTAWNKGAEQMSGWREDEVLGRTFGKLCL
jgi:PAS domain S-box-containing protein